MIEKCSRKELIKMINNVLALSSNKKLANLAERIFESRVDVDGKDFDVFSNYP